MKTIAENEDQGLPANSNKLSSKLQIFSTVLRDGTEVVIREMTGKDLVYIEEELESLADMRKNFHIMELLSVGAFDISYDYVESLGVQDIKKISELIAKANGDEENKEGEGPKEKKKR